MIPVYCTVQEYCTHSPQYIILAHVTYLYGYSKFMDTVLTDTSYAVIEQGFLLVT